ncbi:MAG: cell wall metabolism sensor histidine kinase WalK, partial [Magnetospirillum sp.]|nr:cell wall metabolism sensor histidine kinase WalK [Magnetospirillum sp.]
MTAKPRRSLSRKLSRLRSDFIGHKLILAVGVAVSIGLLALVTFYAGRQEANIKAHNERTMRNVTESVIESLQTVMLAGYADIAQVFADKLKSVPGVVDFRILRIDGNEAFRDNKTIADVNKRRGQEDFLTRDEENVVPVLASSHRDFRRALEERRIVTFYETSSDGEEFLTFLAPVLSEDKCQKCHGKVNPVRGVLKLTTSLGPVSEDVRRSWLQSILVLAVAIITIMVVTNLLIRRSVVSPIITMSTAMAEVSRGELSLRVPVLSGDELGQMAKSFNHMTDELRATLRGFESERNKLTTIILSADEGMVVTDPGGRVVLVNPAAERLLGKHADRIIQDGFLSILDDPKRMHDWLHRPSGVKGEIIHYGDR